MQNSVGQKDDSYLAGQDVRQSYEAIIIVSCSAFIGLDDDPAAVRTGLSAPVQTSG